MYMETLTKDNGPFCDSVYCIFQVLLCLMSVHWSSDTSPPAYICGVSTVGCIVVCGVLTLLHVSVCTSPQASSLLCDGNAASGGLVLMLLPAFSILMCVLGSLMSRLSGFIRLTLSQASLELILCQASFRLTVCQASFRLTLCQASFRLTLHQASLELTLCHAPLR